MKSDNNAFIMSNISKSKIGLNKHFESSSEETVFVEYL